MRIRIPRAKRSALFMTVLFSLCLSEGPDAFAKVIFTGYADLRNTYGVSEIRASRSTLDSISITRTKSQESAFNIDSLGLFASSSFNEVLSFDTDVTYKSIGFKTGEIRLQYAHLNYDSPSLFRAKAGKIKLPLGYYNQNFFYPFQRKSIEAPIFQSAILGLPISDIGVNAEKVLDSEPVRLKLSAYAVNGYGHSDSGTNVFRPGLGASGALILSNNLKATNSNDTLAAGGQIELGFLKDKRMKFGVSGYYGPWSSNSKDDFVMLNGHLFFNHPAFEFLAEYLHTQAHNDRGVVGFYGTDDWKSDGFFVESAVPVFARNEKKVHWVGGVENTVLRGKSEGSGTEELLNYKTGFSLRLNDFITFKTEFSHLKYQIPIQSGGVPNNINLDRDRFYLNATVSY